MQSPTDGGGNVIEVLFVTLLPSDRTEEGRDRSDTEAGDLEAKHEGLSWLIKRGS